MAGSTLALVLAQFALAGTALFVSPSWWSVHAAAGAALAVPLIGLLVQTRRAAPGATLRQPTGWLVTLYVAQVLLAALSDEPGLTALRAAHVANAALVLCMSLYLALRAVRMDRSA